MYHKYKLSEKSLTAINNPSCRLCLAMALGVTEQTIINAIRKNKDLLTTKTAVEIIKAETGFLDEEIFTVNNLTYEYRKNS